MGPKRVAVAVDEQIAAASKTITCFTFHTIIVKQCHEIRIETHKSNFTCVAVKQNKFAKTYFFLAYLTLDSLWFPTPLPKIDQ